MAAAQDVTVHLLDSNDEELKRHSLYECFGYELSMNGAPYVLSSGVWYEVVSSFVSQTNNAVKAVPDAPLKLPKWNQKDDERVYNAECHNINGLMNCDRQKLFYGGGMSLFEFCDLIHFQTKTLFFIKIASKSAGMSHLVEQARRTSELLFSTDDGYRKKLSALFKKHHPNANRTWLQKRPKNGDWRFCLVSLGRTKEKLPFFAKCGLVKLARDLNERGHPISFTAV